MAGAALGEGLSEVQQILSQYSCTPRYIRPQGSVHKVIAEEGIYALKCSPVPKDRLQKIQSLLQELRQEGYLHLLPLLSTKAGEKILSTAQGSWYMTPWRSAASLPKDRWVNGIAVARALARFHRLAARRIERYPTLLQEEENLLQHWKKQQQYWRQQQQSVEDFTDPQAKKLCAAYQEKVEQAFSFALRGLEKFLIFEKGKPPRFTLCHRRIHPSNVVRGEEGFYFLDFDDSCIDSPVRDLALLIRRYRNDSAEGEQPRRLLAAYEEEWRLRSKEKKLLAIYLAYPEQIIRRCRRPLPPVEEEEALEIAAEPVVSVPPVVQQRSALLSIWQEELQHLEQLQSTVRSLWYVRQRLSGGIRVRR